MSRIGKLPISIPAGVTINVSDDNKVTVKGPKGEMSQVVDPSIKINISEGYRTPVLRRRRKALYYCSQRTEGGCHCDEWCRSSSRNR